MKRTSSIAAVALLAGCAVRARLRAAAGTFAHGLRLCRRRRLRRGRARARVVASARRSAPARVARSGAAAKPRPSDRGDEPTRRALGARRAQARALSDRDVAIERGRGGTKRGRLARAGSRPADLRRGARCDLGARFLRSRSALRPSGDRGCQRGDGGVARYVRDRLGGARANVLRAQGRPLPPVRRTAKRRESTADVRAHAGVARRRPRDGPRHRACASAARVDARDHPAAREQYQ